MATFAEKTAIFPSAKTIVSQAFVYRSLYESIYSRDEGNETRTTKNIAKRIIIRKTYQLKLRE